MAGNMQMVNHRNNTIPEHFAMAFRTQKATLQSPFLIREAGELKALLNRSLTTRVGFGTSEKKTTHAYTNRITKPRLTASQTFWLEAHCLNFEGRVNTA